MLKRNSSIEGNKTVNAQTDWCLQVPHWVRGKEWATLMSPRVATLSILGLGTSIGTDNKTLTSEAVVFESFDEMELNHTKVGSTVSLLEIDLNYRFFGTLIDSLISINLYQIPGKIVIFNSPWHGYDTNYRGNGAWRASKYGAVAVLIRSVTDLSVYSPHTGVQVGHHSLHLPS